MLDTSMASALRPGLLRFFLTVTSIIGVLHLYIGARILDAFNLSTLGKCLVIAAILVAYLAQVMAWLARFLFSQHKYADLFSWLGMLSMGLFSSVLVLTFLRDFVLIGSSYFISYDNSVSLHLYSEIVVLGLAFLASLIGLISVIRTPDVIEIKVPIKHLPKALEDFNLVQLSDIHIGPTIKRKFLASIVKKVNSLAPSAVAITGDLVDGSVEKLGEDVSELKHLRSAYGTFFVTGNHEYYSGANDWINFLRALGVQVLVNEHRIIYHNESPVVMAGICDFNAHQFIPQHKSNPALALSGTENLDALKIMLAHQPRSANAVAETGAHLQLSGHTHGGQFWPWNFFVKLQQPYNVGLHKLHNLWIYINRGTGYWGPPKRLGRRSEITLIRFVHED